MHSKFKVAVLASGRGTNLKSLLANQKNYQISAVLSDKSDAYALSIAEEAGVPFIISFPRSKFADKSEQKNAIYSELEQLEPDLICLAGFMQIIQADFAKSHFGKIINIHPSLLPKFTGLDTHKRAIAAKEKIHGCSVHYVDAGLDTGPLIAQASCAVLETDTQESLSARVLNLEHEIYPWVVNSMSTKEIYLSEQMKTVFSDRLIQQAIDRKFILPS